MSNPTLKHQITLIHYDVLDEKIIPEKAATKILALIKAELLAKKEEYVSLWDDHGEPVISTEAVSVEDINNILSKGM